MLRAMVMPADTSEGKWTAVSTRDWAMLLARLNRSVWSWGYRSDRIWAREKAWMVWPEG